MDSDETVDRPDGPDAATPAPRSANVTEAPTPRRGTPERVRSTSRSSGSRRTAASEEPEATASIPTVPTNIYRARRPGVAILLVIPAVAVGVLIVRGFAIAAFGDPFDSAGVIGTALALASLPMIVSGIYGLVTGAAHGAEHFGFRIWARPPLAYLLVGLGLALAAGVALN